MSRHEAPRVRTPSSTLAVGVATAFLVLAALAGLFADDKVAVGAAGWSLRGTFAPNVEGPPTRPGA